MLGGKKPKAMRLDCFLFFIFSISHSSVINGNFFVFSDWYVTRFIHVGLN